MIPPCMMMYLLDKNGNLKKIIRYLIYFIAASFSAVGMNFSFSDDGLRHLSFANSKDIMVSWGKVFPHSLFGDYDPWNFWDSFLSFIIKISSFEIAHIIVNIISLFILLVILDKMYSLELKKFKNTIPLILMIFLLHGFHRYTNLRPDLISGFFIMCAYIISKIEIAEWKKSGLIIILTILYMPMYYLFFVYTVAIFAYLFLIKDLKNSLIVLGLTVLGFFYYYFAFGQESLEIVKYVLNDESLRNGLFVGEGTSYFEVFDLIGIKYLMLVYLIILLIAKIKFGNFLTNNKLFTFILTFSLLWIGQMRYYELFVPIFELFIVSLFLNLNSFKIKKILHFIKIIIIFIRKELFATNRNISFIIIFSLFLAFESGMNGHGNSINDNSNKVLAEKEFKNKIYNNKTILFTTLSKEAYYAIYANPSIKEIPSCSIGWDKGSKKFRDLYKKMLIGTIKQSELIQFANLSNVDFIFMKIPINKKSVYSFNYFKNSNYKPYKIFENFIIFNKVNEK